MKATYNGETYELPEPGLADMVAFERHYQMPSSVLADQAAARIEWMCFLAYRGLRKLGAAKEFGDDFLDGLTDIDFTDAEKAADEADPTAPAVPST